MRELLMRDPSIGQTVVIRDRRRFLDPDGAGGLARPQGWPTELKALARHLQLCKHIEAGPLVDPFLQSEIVTLCFVSLSLCWS